MDPQHQIHLGHALVQSLTRFALAATLLAAASCSGATARPPDQLPTRISSSETIHVSSARDLKREATRETALRIMLAAGRYEVGALTIRHPVELSGPSSGIATVVGDLEVRSDGVRLRALQVEGSLKLRGARNISGSRLVVSAGSAPYSIEVDGSIATFTSIELSCGAKACMAVRTSTVHVRSAILRGAKATLRGLVAARSSSVTASGIEVFGSTIAQIQARDGAVLSLTDATLVNARGAGLVATNGARIDARRVQLRGGVSTAVLLSRSDATLEKVAIGGTRDLSAGVQGGRVTFRDCSIERSARGVVSVSDHITRRAKVDFIGGQIAHADRTGLAIGQGDVTVRDTWFQGAPGPKRGDAITVSGNSALLEITGARIDDPAGFGVGFYNDAGGAVTAKINRPGLGGVLVESVAGVRVAIKDTQISQCVAGSGIAVFDALDVQVSSVVVRDCAGGGVVAGANARAELIGARLIGNRRHSLAAYEGAILRVSGADVRDAARATYVSCAQGGQVIDLGNNHFRGLTARCP